MSLKLLEHSSSFLCMLCKSLSFVTSFSPVTCFCKFTSKTLIVPTYLLDKIRVGIVGGVQPPPTPQFMSTYAHF